MNQALYFAVCNAHPHSGEHYTQDYYIIPMRNVHPYFSLKNLCKKCTLHSKIW